MLGAIQNPLLVCRLSNGGQETMISARSRRIAIVVVAVFTVCMLAVRAYRWLAPHASSLPARVQSSEPGSPAIERYPYFCTKVLDGDTIVVKSLGHVRLIGIDTPEMNYDFGVPQPFAEEARGFCRRLVLNKTVSLEFDEVKRDKYGRALAYVFVGDTFANAELVKAGLAKAYHIPPNDRYKTNFGRLERNAKRDHLGLWAK